jgi:hypothetical protein
MDPVINPTSETTYYSELLTYTNTYASMAEEIIQIIQQAIATPVPTSTTQLKNRLINISIQANQQVTVVNQKVNDTTIQPLSVNVLGLVNRINAYFASPSPTALTDIMSDSLSYKTAIKSNMVVPGITFEVYQAYNTLWCFLLALRGLTAYLQLQKLIIKAEMTDILSTKTTGDNVVQTLGGKRVTYDEQVFLADAEPPKPVYGTHFTVTEDGVIIYRLTWVEPPLHQGPPQVEDARTEWENFWQQRIQTDGTAALSPLDACYIAAQNFFNAL